MRSPGGLHIQFRRENLDGNERTCCWFRNRHLTEMVSRNGKSKRTGLKSRHYNKHGASVWRRKVQRFGASAKGSSARASIPFFGHLRCEPLGVGGTVYD